MGFTSHQDGGQQLQKVVVMATNKGQTATVDFLQQHQERLTDALVFLTVVRKATSWSPRSQKTRTCVTQVT